MSDNLKHLTKEELEAITSVSLPIVIEPLHPTGKIIDVYGDSFAALHKLVVMANREGSEIDNVKFSWLWFVSQLLVVTIRSYGLCSRSEQLIYKSYQRTIDNARNSVMIVQSDVTREDRFFKYPRMKKQDYIEWDNKITEPTLHLYWSSRFHKFKNGFAKNTDLHTAYSSVGKDEAPVHFLFKPVNFNHNEKLKGMAANHMDINGNFILAIEVVQMFKDKFEFDSIV